LIRPLDGIRLATPAKTAVDLVSVGGRLQESSAALGMFKPSAED